MIVFAMVIYFIAGYGTYRILIESRFLDPDDNTDLIMLIVWLPFMLFVGILGILRIK